MGPSSGYNIKMENEKVISMLNKLRALSEKGVGGEKENARQFLIKLLNKHGLTLEDIEGEVKAEHGFRFKNEAHRKFLGQIICHVCGINSDIYTYKNHDKHVLQIVCTVAQMVEIKTRAEFYWKAYQEELKLFYRAFIHKNKLTAAREEGDEEPELTIKELEELEQIRQMMQGMRRHTHLQRLEQ